MRLPTLLLAPSLLAALALASGRQDGAPVDFVREVEPLLAARCYDCHGPDRQKSGLRLDVAEQALFGGDSGAPAIVPGDPDGSELVRRITAADELDRMPAKGPPLTGDEVALLRRWIAGGAPRPVDGPLDGPDHWSYVPPERPVLPAVADEAWVRNSVDRFVLARLEAEGIAPAPEADRATLIRRASLDLVGLPPTSEEVAAFLSDDRPGAYERLVDRLLASRHFGERWARHWLDLARYSDSNGYTFDSPRSIWPWRDWVIQALNADKPFDEFTIEQIAGDLLPDPTIEQIVATGFHRNTPVNEEAGADEGEFRVEAIKNRVDTTATVWLGSTLQCAQCHSHKYDPFTQRDYYRFFAFYNNTTDRGVRRPSRDHKGLEPVVELPTERQEDTITRMEERIAQLEQVLTVPSATYEDASARWERGLSDDLAVWSDLEPVAAEATDPRVQLVLGEDGVVAPEGGQPYRVTYTVTARSTLDSVSAVRLDVLPEPGKRGGGPGRSRSGNFVLTGLRLEASVGDARPRPLAIRDARSTYHQLPQRTGLFPLRDREFPVADVLDEDPLTGWAIGPETGTAQSAVFFLEEPLHTNGEGFLTFTLEQDYGLRLSLGRFRLQATGAELGEDTVVLPPDVEPLLSVPPSERRPKQANLLWRYFTAHASEFADVRRRLERLRKKRPEPITSLVMRERRHKVPRETYLLLRGSFRDFGPVVDPGVPDFLPDLDVEGGRATRLELARWLVSPDNPLTARVTGNRLWQRLFGLGLVETENDFGTRGSPPSHPELLDWLALELVDRGWSLKSTLKLLVTSATYRQSSHPRAELAEIDPRNRLLARQARLRNDAETIRDAALVASGLLNPQPFGPPIHPPQPRGVFNFTQTSKRWEESRVPERYRRSLYIWHWRTSSFPYLTTFDAPLANVPCTRRDRSNTPLQALTQANDPMLVEIAQGLARRALALAVESDDERLTAAFHWVVSRAPDEDEGALLRDYLEAELRSFSADPAAAALAAPEGLPEGIEPARAAAWTSVGRVLLNLDEFLTRG